MILQLLYAYLQMFLAMVLLMEAQHFQYQEEHLTTHLIGEEMILLR